MPRKTSEPTTDERGTEHHPAFAVIGASRVTGGDSVLFDSDIQHQQTVIIRVQTASRSRQGSHDYIHGNRMVTEVQLSEAQWASFVSSMNTGDGVPCTLRFSQNDPEPDMLVYAPRLAKTMDANKKAAHVAFDAILASLAKLEEVEKQEKPSMKARREALWDLKCVIQNAVPNVDYAGKRLAEHAEDVVQKARADIEAIVTRKAVQLGIDPAQTQGILQLGVE